MIAVLLMGFLVGNVFGFGEYRTSSDPSQDVSLSYGLVVDNSGSLRARMDQIRGAAESIFDGSYPNDEAFLIRFVHSENIETLQELTQNKGALIRAVGQLRPEGGETAIFDAVYLSARYLSQNGQAESANRRRALVLITDGEDRSSNYKIGEVLELLRSKRIRVFAIGLTTNLKKERGKQAYEKAVALLNKFASETGGRAYFPKSPEELQSNAKEILSVMRQ
jgi:Ca-activated chloride channel family protein